MSKRITMDLLKALQQLPKINNTTRISRVTMKILIESTGLKEKTIRNKMSMMSEITNVRRNIYRIEES